MKSAKKIKAVKTVKKGPQDIDAYSAEFPENVRDILESLRRKIGAAAPGAEETMGYGIPTFTLHGNLVHFAGYKRHIGFYPGPSAIKAFAGELSDYVQAKGSVQFPIEKRIPYALIVRMVKFRVKENMAKHLSGPAKKKKKS